MGRLEKRKRQGQVAISSGVVLLYCITLGKYQESRKVAAQVRVENIRGLVRKACDIRWTQ